MTVAQTEAGVLSPTGECKTFDATANGYSRGEAVNAILIKKLSDAVRDKDPIRAVIRATASNCDGRSKGITTPNPESHEKLIRRAYQRAQLQFSDTGFVECHGTGTPTGDPLELEAIAKVFGGTVDGVHVGSIKPNVGHAEGASGVSSVVKAVMALENKTIPPQVNFKSPNPRIPFKEANLTVPLDATSWPKGRSERVSVNSFGISGANAHAIIDSAASYGYARQITAVEQSDSRPRLLLFSANNNESLRKNAVQLQEYAEKNSSSLESLAYTLAMRREHLPSRAFCVTDGLSSAELVTADKSKKAPSITFAFTGQGAQWPAMGKELIDDFSTFRDSIRALESTLAKLPTPPTWSLEEELLKLGPKSNLDHAEFAQPLCTAIQIALVDLLRSLGIRPSAVTGHSSGEIAAAYAAGAITAEEAVIVAYYRGQVAKESTRRGAMAAIGLGRAEVSLYLDKGVVVACENSPSSITLSGDEDQLDAVIEQMKFDDPDVFARKLKTGGMAYHSHHMHDLGELYESHIKPYVESQRPTVPFFSSVTGKEITEADLGSSYWRQNLESPVRFYPAVRALLESRTSDQLFLEIGPHSALAGPLRQIFKAVATKGELTYTSTLVRGKDSTGSLLSSLGQLYLQSIPINFAPLTPNGQTLTDLPAYSWRHDTAYWAESRISKEW